MIKLTDEDIAPFTGGLKEFLEKDDTGWILPSLKYTLPSIPKKANEKPKPLTNDQKLQNNLFNLECKKVWKSAKEELKNRVIEAVYKAEMSRREADKKKGTANNNNNNKTPREIEEAVERSKRIAEKNVLYALSIARLKAWIEEDEDKALKKAKEEADEQQMIAKKSHEQFVKQKDSLRIRLPPPEVIATLRPQSAPRMSFSSGSTVPVRPKGKAGPESTVDLMLMANTGQKYVYATKKGRQGMEGDLEKGKKLVW